MFATVPGRKTESSVAGVGVLTLGSHSPLQHAGPVNAWRRVVNTMIGNSVGEQDLGLAVRFPAPDLLD
jgi:hypothetical protein